ncbi:MAG: type V CRISPR-associated protein Cas12a/Cpf1 [bacterium]|nr:type V CRISPR-associated protein Cas12a/Cpf1 [bacterium]
MNKKTLSPSGSFFDNFTQQYKLSKTLRFELRPVGETLHFMQEHKVVEIDKSIEEAYQKLKPLVDAEHRAFIERSLVPENVSDIDFSEYEESLAGGKDAIKKQNTSAKKLYTAILDKMDGYKDICSKDVLDLVAEHGEVEHEIADTFKGFTTYLTKYQETRANLYKSDGTATAVPTRIVENYVIYRNNREIADKASHQVMLDVDGYTNYFTQSGINVYNELIGAYNADTKKLRDKASKSERGQYPLLKKMHNQILAEQEIEEDEYGIAFIDDVAQRYSEYIAVVDDFSAQAKGVIKILPNLSQDEQARIWLTNRAINTLVRKLFIDWQGIEFALTADEKKRKAGEAKVPAFVSLVDVASSLSGAVEDVFKKSYITEENKDYDAYEYFVQYLVDEVSRIDAEYDSYKNQFEVGSFSKNDEQLKKLKEVLDCGLSFLQVMRYFVLSAKKEADVPTDIHPDFYEPLNELIGDLKNKNEIVLRYDAFRNFLTKKPDAKDKVKLNFDSGTLLSGFDKNKESEKLGLIFRKDGEYFMGILNKEARRLFDDIRHADVFDVGGDVYEKMEYKLFPDPKRMIPKVAFAEVNAEKLGRTEEIISLKRDYKRFQTQKGDDWSLQFDKDKLTKLIEYYQHALVVLGYKKTFDLSWKKAGEYENLGSFNEDIARQKYRVIFRSVSSDWVDKAVANGKLYLFKIYNKDFSPKSSGRRNLHTEYFINMFSGENLAKPVIKLSGGAEVFFRDPKVSEKKTKQNREGKILNGITEKKRYTEERYFLHIPIELNTNASGAPKYPKQLNEKINKEVLSQKPVSVIGVDRGEKHLAYYSLINSDGEVLKSGSFNTINDQDYHEKLDESEKLRKKERQSWHSISRIKDLKRGYISQVVHELVRMAIKHNAIVVLEDLNFRFKQVRGGIEKSIYQQFEKALIDKLGYLVFKDREPNEPGGVSNAYQLATPVAAMSDIGKQTGIVFYAAAEYTSTTDPITGWRQHIYLKSTDSITHLKDVFANKIKLGWNSELGSYTFTYNQRDFSKQLPAKKWVMVARVPRLVRYRDPSDQMWKTNTWDPNERIEALLRAWDFEDHELYAEDISDIIAGKYSDQELGGKRAWRGVGSKPEGFFQGLAFILKMVQQIRNATTGEVREYANGKIAERNLEDDFIASPVAPYFMTSSNIFSAENTCGLNGVDNGDALGAYNIARKGLIMLEEINKNPEKPKLIIKREEWDLWAQQHEYSRE